MAPDRREATLATYPQPVALRSAPSAQGAPVTVVVDVEPEVVRRGLIALLEEDDGVRVAPRLPDSATAGDVDVAVLGPGALARVELPCPIIVCSDGPAGRR
jgi:hypothetical protein